MADPVALVVDTAAPGRTIQRSWETAVGCGDAWSILRADLQEQLRRAVQDCGFRYLRCHGILCDQLQAVRRDRSGALVYNWQLVDKVYDALLDIGLRPFVELAYMPSALASGDQTVFHYRGNVTPPADYAAWNGFIAALVGHWRERYGADELRRWYFEVWNEANLSAFWSSTREEYFRLYAETVHVVKAIDSSLRVGGPATSRGEWLPEFLAWCRQRGAPVDFVSTHVYPDDDEFEKVDPDYRAIFNRGNYLEALVGRTANSVAGERPIGDPSNGTRRLEQHWTEWNSSWRWGRPIHDETNQAAYICRAIHHIHAQVDSFAFWTISDIFNEFPYPRSALVGGFGLLTIDGLPKPGYHAYCFLHRLGDVELPATCADGDDGDRLGQLDCWATRTSGEGYRILLASYVPPGLADPAVPLDPAILPQREVIVQLRGLGAKGNHGPRLVEYRVDRDHANVLAAWDRLGRPDTLSRGQLAELRLAAEMCPSPARQVRVDPAGELTLPVSLPPGSVVLLDLSYS